MRRQSPQCNSSRGLVNLEACILTSSVWCLNWLPLMVITGEITGLLTEKESQSTDVKFHELMASWLAHSPLIGPNYLPIEAHGHGRVGSRHPCR